MFVCVCVCIYGACEMRWTLFESVWVAQAVCMYVCVYIWGMGNEGDAH